MVHCARFGNASKWRLPCQVFFPTPRVALSSGNLLSDDFWEWVKCLCLCLSLCLKGCWRATPMWALVFSVAAAAAAGCLTCPVYAGFWYTSHAFFVMEFLRVNQMEFWLRVSTLRVAEVVMYRCLSFDPPPHRGGEEEHLLKLFSVGTKDLAECGRWIAIRAHLREDVLVA